MFEIGDRVRVTDTKGLFGSSSLPEEGDVGTVIYSSVCMNDETCVNIDGKSRDRDGWFFKAGMIERLPLNSSPVIDMVNEPPPAPETPPVGMSSDDLASYVDEFIRACTSRINGVGDEQYSTETHQKFETLPIGDLLTWAREEIQDIANYSAMLDIRLARVQKALNGTDVG